MGKPVRAVLRGLGGSNPVWLPGRGGGDITSLPDQLWGLDDPLGQAA